MSEPQQSLREHLAELCHAQWSGWMRHLYRRLSTAGLALDDAGPNRVIEPDDYVRWLRQMETTYADLSDAEKDSDRAEADRFIALIGDADRNARFAEKVRESIATATRAHESGKVPVSIWLAEFFAVIAEQERNIYHAPCKPVEPKG